ncbi:MAG: hypothetical protein J0H94_02850 [Rhizobiales bacterium]|nr:hypothetical protein [Hyphomicrobiales bacterium]
MPGSKRRENLTEHPFFTSVARDGSGVLLASFMGYVGPPAGEDTLTLFAAIDTPTDSVEIPLRDIVHVEDVPETTIPFGAKLVWVRDGARIVRRRTATAEAAVEAQRRHAVELGKGRLRMRIPGRVRAAEEDCRTCVSVCISICQGCEPCTSECGPPPAAAEI